MSRYLVVGDPHAKPENLDKIRKLCIRVEEYNLPVIWLGDLLDTKDIVRAQCLNTYINYFFSSNLHHYVLVGNHDYGNNDCEWSSLEPLRLLPNVTLVSEPYQLNNKLFVPYYRDNNKLRTDLSKFKDIEILIGHLDIKSFDYGNGFISDEGLQLEELKDYKLVISGHYHKFQDRGNIIYLGTPFSHSFGESNQDKYLGILNDDDSSFCTMESNFPRHITIEVDAGNPHHFDTNNTDHFRIILKGTQEELDAFDASSYTGFKIVRECQAKVVKSGLKETETPEVIYSKWFNEIKKQEDQELYTLGLDILKDSK